MAGIVYEGVTSTADSAGKLFEGQNFWFSSAVPQRKWLIENAIANGATVVPLEKQADVLIVDHARKNAPVGTHSYKFIEQSIRNGILEDLADHVVGPSRSVDRPVGSMITAPKGSRSKYTEAEDQLLWDFIKPYEAAGGATGGNEIYKQLEETHGTGRHTYQSWRDRWLKHVRFQNRQSTDSAYTANNAEGATAQVQRAVQASPQRRAQVSVIPAVCSPPKTAGREDPKAPLNSQRSKRTEPTNLEDATTAHFRQVLERKLGRTLPSGPTSLNFRDWEPLPATRKPQDGAGTEAVELQRPQAGIGTHLPTETDPLKRKPLHQSQPDFQEAVTEEVSTSESQVSIEEFPEEEYKLLLDAAGEIIRVGDHEEDWDRLAIAYPSHSSRAWRGFWEGKVKPDYLKQLSQIKKEQELPEGEHSRLETIRESAHGSAKYDNRGPSNNEGIDDEKEGAVEEVESDGDVENEGSQHEDAVSHSLFSTSRSASPQDSSPFSCRWIGCDADIPNLSMLIEHVSSRHKPGTKKTANDCGYTCRWRGCSKVRVDENGNPIGIVLDLRIPQVWANHFIKEHIRTIQLRHGLGPSPMKRPGAANEPRKVTNTAVESEAVMLSFDDSQVMRGSPFQRSTLVSPRWRQRRNRVVLDESSEEADLAMDTSEDDSDEGDEAEETEQTSSSAKLTNEQSQLSTSEEDLSPNSNEDHDDRDANISPRRSKRLRNTPRPPHIKDAAITYVDAAVGSSPPLPQSTPERDTTKHLMQPLSLSPSKPPEPNEARKRSATKGNSQESNQSIMEVQETLGLHAEESDRQPSMFSPRKRTREPEAEPEPELESARQQSPELPDAPSFEHQVKRRKQRPDDTEPLEIPTTPEHRTVLGDLQQKDEYEASSMLGGSPTPRPRARFVSDENNLAQTPTRRADLEADSLEHTSPLQISMFSDPDINFVPSSPAKSTSTRQDDLSSEPDLQFETAPQTTSNLWITAPSEEPEEDAEQETQYETAPEPKGKDRERLGTPSLFVESIPDIDNDQEDPFALPEPDGGWPDDMDEGADLGGPLTELPIPTSYQSERADDIDADEDEDDDDDDDAASIPSDVQGWVEERTAEDESLDLEALLCAIQATSGFNEKLIIEVHDFICARELQGHPDSLPRHVKGCWTAEDDESLKRRDARERLRILKKHGRSNVDRRSAWLDVDV